MTEAVPRLVRVESRQVDHCDPPAIRRPPRGAIMGAPRPSGILGQPAMRTAWTDCRRGLVPGSCSPWARLASTVGISGTETIRRASTATTASCPTTCGYTSAISSSCAIVGGCSGARSSSRSSRHHRRRHASAAPSATPPGSRSAERSLRATGVTGDTSSRCLEPGRWGAPRTPHHSPQPSSLPGTCSPRTC